MIPASETAVDTRIRLTDGRNLVTNSDLAQAQVKNFEDKRQWFQDNCLQLRVAWSEAHVQRNLRRQYLLQDSMETVMSLSPDNLRKFWKIEFIDEPCIDCRENESEWFELVCKEIFDPNMGLWMSLKTNQTTMTINPASGTYLGRQWSPTIARDIPVLTVISYRKQLLLLSIFLPKNNNSCRVVSSFD